MVQGTVIEGLGMGGFRPVEEIIVLPLLHVPDDGCGIGGSLGVIGHTGAGKGQAEIHQIHDQLHAHYRNQHQRGQGSAPAAGGFFPGHKPLLRILRKGFGILTVGKYAYIKDQKNHIDQQKHPALILDQVLPQPVGAGHDAQAQARCHQQMPELEAAAQQPGPVGHV